MHDSIESLRAALIARRGAFGDVARASGLSYSWVCKFATGARRNPTVASIQRLQRAIDQIPPTDADDAGADAAPARHEVA